MFPSTAKQRLWLTCLGYDVPDSTTSDEARAIFEEAPSSGRYQEAMTGSQAILARSLGIVVGTNEGCHEVAGKLYHLLLLRAWVYSVCRFRLGLNAGAYSALGLPDESVVKVARQMLDAGMFEQIQKYSTTDGRESDVFYRMSKSAQQSIAFTFVVERFQPRSDSASLRSADRTYRQPTDFDFDTDSEYQKKAKHSRRSAAKKRQGCFGFILLGISGVLAYALVLRHA